jgi:hypothetical protein
MRSNERPSPKNGTMAASGTAKTKFGWGKTIWIAVRLGKTGPQGDAIVSGVNQRKVRLPVMARQSPAFLRPVAIGSDVHVGDRRTTNEILQAAGFRFASNDGYR